MRKKNKRLEPLHISNLRIPDEDLLEWMRTLKDCGFTAHEGSIILVRVSTTYARKLLAGPVSRRLAFLNKRSMERRGRPLDEAETAYIRRQLLIQTRENVAMGKTPFGRIPKP